MAKRQLGRLALGLDAGYCGLAAVCLLAFAEPLGDVFDVTTALILGLAGATAGWALLLTFAALADNVKPWLLVVLLINCAAAGLIAALATARQSDAVTLLLFAVAVEVAGFAAAQAVALRQPLA